VDEENMNPKVTGAAVRSADEAEPVSTSEAQAAAGATSGAPQPAAKEATARAILAGIVFGLIFGAANAYLGLRVGMTVSTSIPVAVMTVALFRALGSRISILEANMAQTIGSASTALATGAIFTIPALYLWGITPPYLQIVCVTLLGGILGISAMIPLRDLLIVRSAKELPYPEGTACAEVLNAAVKTSTKGSFILWGLALGVGVKLLISLFGILPEEIAIPLPFLPNAELGLEVAPALIAVGYILGYRQSAVVVSGSVISALVLIPLITIIGAKLPTPLYPETQKLVSEMSAGNIWSRYVRYIGAGAVATAGIATVIRSLPAMVSAFAAVTQGVRRGKDASDASGAPARTDRDLPGWVVFAGVAVVIIAVALIPGVLGTGLSLGQRAVCAAGVAVFGVAFVTVASRIVGIVGVSSQPTSGITLVTLLGVASVFAAAHWTETYAKAAVLTVGSIVAIAASKAGDISQDLKTGHLVGATPAKQQVGQYIGAITACWAVAGTLLFLGKAYTFGSADLPAPQAMLMKTIIEGVLSGSLPWGYVLAGGGISLGAMLMGVGGLAFAIGVYLPLAAMAPIFIGGCVQRVVAWRRGDKDKDKDEDEAETGAGVLAASGIVAGEGVAGVLVAVLVGAFHVERPKAPYLSGTAGTIAVLVLVLLISAFLARAARQKHAS
jgi:putative OPT family oligopeptide transporter